jgi:hypothetical protein
VDPDPDPPTTHFSLDLDPPILQNDPLRLPPFQFDADPDPASQNDSDPDSQHCLLILVPWLICADSDVIFFVFRP